MALIICPECGKEYSDRAGACPNCACPAPHVGSTEVPGNAISPPKEKKKHSIIPFIILIALFAVGAWYAYRTWSYNDGLNAMYSGDYSTARKRLEGLDYNDSNWVLNDISFFEDMEAIVREEISRGYDDVTDIMEEASQTLERIRKYQAMEFHTDGLDSIVDQYRGTRTHRQCLRLRLRQCGSIRITCRRILLRSSNCEFARKFWIHAKQCGI